MSSMKPINSTFDSVASIVNFLREPSPSAEVVSSTTTSMMRGSPQMNNNQSKSVKKSKKEKDTVNVRNERPANTTVTVPRLESGRVRYGPITVNPRKQPSKTLYTGRRSKYEVLGGEEEEKRRLRRERNRVAATKCREKRENILQDLEIKHADEESRYTNLLKTLQQLEQRKKNLESILSSHIGMCPFEQQQQNSMIFGDTTFLETMTEPPVLPRLLPPPTMQLIANNEEEFNAFIQPAVPIVLTNSAYESDQTNYLFNSQQQQPQTIEMTTSSLDRILNSVPTPTFIDNNNNTTCSGLFNSAYGTSCAQQHSSSSEDDSLPPSHQHHFVC